MKHLLLSLVIGLHALAGLGASSKPNIVLILADDLGWSDLGCYGGEIETPHLDSLARGGLRFTQFYNAARCCPTRAALLTGLYPHQTGIGHMAENRGIPSYQGYLNDRCVTLAEALRPAGYRTMMAGKWHVGPTQGRWPMDRGFDRYWGTPAAGGIYFRESLEIRKEVFFVDGNERVPPPDNFYITDALTDHALEFINEAVRKERKPFFLYLAHVAPHWPLQAKDTDIKKYRGRYDAGWDVLREKRFARQQQMGLLPAGARLSPRDPAAASWDSLTEQERKERAGRMEIYAAQIDCIDQNVGRLVKKLKDLGQFENTIVLFLSDNGCSAEGGPGGFSRGKEGAPIGTGLSYASAGLEWANLCDTPFRKFKITTHEGGISTPLIVHWPQGIEARGELRHDPGHIIDIMPTLLDLGGTAYPVEHRGKPLLGLEGRSLVPNFKGRAPERGALFWEHQGNKAVRVGPWKAVKAGTAPWELYNLSGDRSEGEDLAGSHTEKLTEMTQLWRNWAARCGVWDWSKVQQQEAQQPRRQRAAQRQASE